MNYTLQDILSSALAFALFPLVIVIPGYVSGWVFDLFDFRKRQPLVRFVLALVLSIAISPILFFLTYRLISGAFTLFLILVFLIAFMGIILRSPKWAGAGLPAKAASRLQGVRRAGIILGGVWAIFVILYLADWQFGDKLYYTVITYDYTTRVSVIDAITRTGVPPVNPSFYPGHPSQLTYLYYFWYVMCSLVDQIGGTWVSARTALTASAAWCGLALMAAIALYFRQRKSQGSLKTWKQSLIGIGCLLISGLDIIPVAIYTAHYTFRWMWGDIEQWNEQITAWIGSVLWVPLHVSSLIACIAGLLLFLHARERKGAMKAASIVIAGISFASAFGLSVFVTLVFVIFWTIWMMTQFFKREERRRAWLMLIPGIVAAVVILPFLVDLFQGAGASGGGGFPFTVGVRKFPPLPHFFTGTSAWLRPLALLVALPINYLMELGFFLVAGLVWLQVARQDAKIRGIFFEVELLLLATAAFLATFIQSKVIASNDFGWRSWLAGQFILLIWSAETLEYFFLRKASNALQAGRHIVSSLRLKKILIFFIVIGMLTTLSDLVLLRIWPMMSDAGMAGFPNMLSRDNRLGERALAAREMYEYLDGYLPQDSMVQFNPEIFLDRPAGLYRMRQAFISTHTLYGVSEEQSQPLFEAAGQLFESENAADWRMLDRICKANQISTLIFSDYDPVWKSRETLKAQRDPLFENGFFAAFACGY
ncbi:MAG: hypothetical protein HFACDABA_02065 [Anaerolineales bacterium]|nr:hypothetical protein [Anaerolineales bacterium]